MAWYLHLKMTGWPMWKAILFSWLIAGGEYMLQVPANRLGHGDAKLSAAQLRAIAEVAILVSFMVFSSSVLKEPIRWNYVVGFVLVFIGVYIVVLGPFNGEVFPSDGGTNDNFEAALPTWNPTWNDSDVKNDGDDNA
eukprot:1541066-Pyramimonas_sp.AAC.1